EVNLGNTDVVTVQPGDIIRITSAGAGGWGNALEREPERVLVDVRCGFVSPEKAKDEYGVVVLDGRVDAEATAALRAQLAAARGRNGFGFDPARVDFERMWTRANYERLTALLAELRVQWRYLVKHRLFESIERLPDRERTGTGDEVEHAFQLVAGQYTQLRQ